MTKKDLSIDNIKLIYEFNKTSPLFSRVAGYEIEQGNYLYAIEILERGLEIHKDYPTAYFIYAFAKAFAGEEKQAKEAVKKGATLLSSKAALEYYNLEIDKIIAERNSIVNAKRPTFVNEKETGIDENKFFNIEERLDILAEELSKAKIKVPADTNSEEDSEIPEYTGKKIASETLAGIYYSQKKYEEAISVYKELIQIHPDNEDYYVQKIVDIETLM